MINKKYIIPCLYLAVAITFCSCTPKPIKLEPIARANNTLDGIKANYYYKDKIELLTAFEESNENTFTLKFWFKNYNDSAISITPYDYSYSSSNGKINNSLIDSNNLYYALNPNIQISKLSNAAKSEIRSYNNDQCLNLGCCLLGAAAAMSEKGTDRKMEKLSENSEFSRRQMENSDIKHFENMSIIQSKVNFWQYDVLKKQSLPKDSVASGFIVFPYEFVKKYFYFNVAVDKTIFHFIYQKIEEPETQNR